MVTFLFGLFLCLAFSQADEGRARCPKGWIRNRNMCYLLMKEASTWQEAVDKCQALDSDLMYVEAEDEADFVAALASKAQRHLWLGGTDEFNEGNFIWHATGKPFTISRWGPDEPNNQGGNQHCSIVESSSGKWDDSTCSNSFWFVCKKSIEICSCRPTH